MSCDKCFSASAASIHVVVLARCTHPTMQVSSGITLFSSHDIERSYGIQKDTIKVSANHLEEIFASHANLFVTVKGSSVVSGNEAMKKAKEVSQLVEALTRFGLSPDAVQLQGVRIETASGMLLKSSSAIYRLKIRCEKLDQLADLLRIIRQRNSNGTARIIWISKTPRGNLISGSR